MKKFFKLFGLAAITAVSAVSCAALDSILGAALDPKQWPETMTLTGRVVVVAGNSEVAYDKGEIAFTGGRGKISDNGTFVYTHGVPDSLADFSAVSEILKTWTDAAPSNDAQFYLLEYLPTEGSYNGVFKGSATTSIGSVSTDRVYYVYVNKDVTITGSESYTSENEDDVDRSLKITIKALNLPLLAGWNAVHLHTRESGIGGPGWREYTYEAEISNSVVYKWVLR